MLHDQKDPKDPQELETRIRRLCASALATEGPEFESLLTELRAALQQHHLELENVITKFLLRLSTRPPEKGPQPTDCQNPAANVAAIDNYADENWKSRGSGRVWQISGD